MYFFFFWQTTNCCITLTECLLFLITLLNMALLPPSDSCPHILFWCRVRGSFLGLKANMALLGALTWHTCCYIANNTLPVSVWQTGRGRQAMINQRCSAHRSQTKHTGTQVHTPDACVHARYLLSITHLSFPIYSMVFFFVSSLISWWPRQMEGLREEWLTNRRACLLWAEIKIINSCCWPLFIWLGYYCLLHPSLFLLFGTFCFVPSHLIQVSES